MVMVRISTVVKWEGSTDGYGDRAGEWVMVMVMVIVTDDTIADDGDGYGCTACTLNRYVDGQMNNCIFFFEPVWPSSAVSRQWDSGCLAVEKKSVAKWREQKKSFVKWRELLLSQLRRQACMPPLLYHGT
jgi:hypothetical protein